MIRGKNWSSQYKLVSLGSALAFLGLVATYLQLQPSVGQDEMGLALTNTKRYEFSDVAPPSGNIFTEGRRIAAQDNDKDAEPVVADEKKVSDFVLASIIERGGRSIAVFIAGDKSVSLSPGQQDPLIGELIIVNGNQATTRLPSGAKKQWELFPITKPANPDKEEAPSS